MSAADRNAAPILSLRGVELRFTQHVDLAGRIANLLGAGLKTQVVHAVAGVDVYKRQRCCCRPRRRCRPACRRCAWRS